MVAALLTTLPTLSIHSAPLVSDKNIPRMFVTYDTIDALPLLLHKSAPMKKYVLITLPNDWFVMNNFFLERINLKLNYYKAEKQIVSPIKDEILRNPTPISWYQDKDVLVLGVPILVVAGFILGVFVAK